MPEASYGVVNLEADAKQQFTYGLGQSSTIGAGTTASGKNGSFADDGSYSW
jgi:hypothetical protein